MGRRASREAQALAGFVGGDARNSGSPGNVDSGSPGNVGPQTEKHDTSEHFAHPSNHGSSYNV